MSGGSWQSVINPQRTDALTDEQSDEQTDHVGIEIAGGGALSQPRFGARLRHVQLEHLTMHNNATRNHSNRHFSQEPAGYVVNDAMRTRDLRMPTETMNTATRSVIWHRISMSGDEVCTAVRCLASRRLRTRPSDAEASSFCRSGI